MNTTVLITGANRGLGLEFVRQYLNAGAHVIATARSPESSHNLIALKNSFGEQLSIFPLDVVNQVDIQTLPQSLAGRPIDMVINNAGIYGPKDERKDLDNLDLTIWQEVLTINTISPLLVTSALLPNLRAGRQKKIIFISSAYGSITSARADTGSYYYSSSKAGMNMAVKKLSDELADEGFTCICVSPGWVKTDMGGEDAELSPEESIHRVRAIIDKITPSDNGGYFSSQGKPMPW